MKNSSGIDGIKRLKAELESADAVIIGAGAGLSTSAGFIYSGERFDKWFSDFSEKYQINAKNGRLRQKNGGKNDPENV